MDELLKKCLHGIVRYRHYVDNNDEMKCNKELTQIFLLRPGCDNVFYEISRVGKYDDVRLGLGELR